MNIPKKSVLVCALTLALAACGGGGGGGGSDNGGVNPNGGGGAPSDPGTVNPDPDPRPSNPDPGKPTPVTEVLLPCVNMATIKCSGPTLSALSQNGFIGMTETSVQVYGKSTSSDLNGPIPQDRVGDAWGLAPDKGGVAEIRVERNGSGNIVRTALMLKDIGLSWDRLTNRPQIIDIFSDRQGRVTQLRDDANRSLAFGPLPPSSDLDFYDWILKDINGTQANYANNYYFPRAAAIRCSPDALGGECYTDYRWYSERQTPKSSTGNWRAQNPANEIRISADEYNVMRFHEDGDLRAGDALPGPNGEPQFRDQNAGNSGFGVSYPGFKGYREFNINSYQYASLANWMTQDTVNIVEWVDNEDGSQEHNKDRRGYVAFGDITPAGSMPASTDTANYTYRGVVYGTISNVAVPSNKEQDVKSFRGEANITVNFNTGRVTVQITRSEIWDDTVFDPDGTYVDVPAANVTGVANLGSAGRVNTFAGRADNATTSTFNLSELGGRFFGPIVAGAPAELGGTLILNGNRAGQTIMAGFIARKQ